MIELLRELYPLRLAPVSADGDQCVSRLLRELPFTVHEYPSGAEHNGWVVPMKWEVIKAEIRQEGKLIYDGQAHPLGVIGYSQSFQGKISLEELKPHLFVHFKWPDGLVYHCDLYYKVGRKDWGFCLPQTLAAALPDGEYEVDLQTVHEPGMMKVCDYFLPGESDDTIVINGHSCHPGQANDDITGVVIGVELMKRLSQRQNRYSYRLIVAPEHFGTVFYLASLSRTVISTYKYGAFLEMLGNNNRLALQESFTGESDIDRAAYNYLQSYRPDFFADKFRKIIGNDETVWEAPGYEVPTISLSRFPYPEYHSSMDTEDIIMESKLDDSLEALLGILNILEKNCVMRRNFDGLIALSNPKYNLYIDQADPSIRPTIPTEQRKWNYLMDCIPRYFDEKTTVLDIAEKHELPFDKVHTYISKFAQCGLVEMLNGSDVLSSRASASS